MKMPAISHDGHLFLFSSYYFFFLKTTSSAADAAAITIAPATAVFFAGIHISVPHGIERDVLGNKDYIALVIGGSSAVGVGVPAIEVSFVGEF